MVKVPLRVSPPLAAKLKVATPFPVPLEAVESHEALEAAVQAPLEITRSEALPVSLIHAASAG